MATAKWWSPEELAKLEKLAAPGVNFDHLVPEFPGRTAYAIYHKAVDLGLLRKSVANLKNKMGNMAAFMKPEEEQPGGDELFQRAMAAAIAAGTETATIGIDTTPGTCRPRIMRAEPLIYIRSNAVLATEIGDPEQTVDQLNFA